jgi:hypothetical protein
MPTFGFSEGDGAAVAVALLSLRARELPPARTTQDPLRASYEPQGEFGRLVRRYRCLSCHSIQGTGGTLSTVALDRIGSQLRSDHVERYVQKPYAIRVGLPERMPHLNIAPEEARVLAEHLSQVMVDDALEAPVPSDPGRSPAVSSSARAAPSPGTSWVSGAVRRPRLNGTARA